MKLIIIGTITALATAATAWSAGAAVGSIGDSATYRNLQIFLVHGNAQLDGRHYATLSEAMARRLVIVKETGSVNELSIENLSRKETVFLNAGDIVKGGRQDRTVRDDLVLPPDSGQVALASFCVEHGRWTRRGSEDAAVFGLNNKVLSSRQLKIASRYDNNQSDVWSGVAQQQEKLTSNVGKLAGKDVEMRNPLSSSSLQLSLENGDLENVTQLYLDKLRPLLDGKNEVIGFVYVINGEINSAEVYNNHALFGPLWPKLLDAAVTEAITDYRSEQAFQPLQPADLRAFFESSLSGAVNERTVSKTTRVKTYTTPTTLLFETLDMDAGGAWIHKSFINKGTQKVIVPLDRDSRGYRQ